MDRSAVEFTIDRRVIGPSQKPYIIAEISANHLGSKAGAIELIQAAAAAGADAIKLQHYTADTITVMSDHPDFQVKGGTLWDGRSLYELYAEAMTPWEWTADLAQAADRAGVTWFSTPFDPSAIEFLEGFDVPAYKIASFEIVDLPLIRLAASKGKPLVISTGMATISEIDRAVSAPREGGASDIALLRCNSGYPASPSEMDLQSISAMRSAWQLTTGLSDHTIGATAAIVAVALGACIIEKHLTLRRTDGGPDAAFSAEPKEFEELVSAVNEAHSALGSIRFGPSEREIGSAAFRRSLRAVKPIAQGERITQANVRSIRPAGGLPPEVGDVLLGMVANQDLEQGAPIHWSDVRPT